MTKLRGRLRFPVRDYQVGPLTDTFLITSVATILVIRAQLWLTGYPQLGGKTLHIAHLLWGGLFMLIALILMLSFLTRRTKHVGAFVGGVGFGFFIDEVGKFVTKDNDYFFKPTAAIIYIFFILLFLVTRALQRSRGLTPRESLMNALELLKDAAIHNLDEGERRRALDFLAQADPSDPLVTPLRGLLKSADALPPAPPGRAKRFAEAARRRYFALVETRRFQRVVGIFFLLWAFLGVVRVFLLAFDAVARAAGLNLHFVIGRVSAAGHVPFESWAAFASSVVAAGFMVAGSVLLRRGRRLDAYHMFDRGLLVSIFITQVFVFIESSFSAVYGMLFNIALLVTLRYMIRQEERRPAAVAPEAAVAPARVTGVALPG